MIVVSDTSPIAALLQIRRIGLLGVLVLARERGLVPSVTEVIQALEAVAGFYVSAAVKTAVLRRAGEVP